MANQETLKRTLAERLEKARRIKGWNQQELADRLSRSKRSIVRYENGEAMPTLPLLIKWAAVCEVPVTWLVDEYASPTDLEGYLGHPSLHVSSSQVNHHSSHQAAA